MLCVLYNGCENTPEFEISGSAAELVDLGENVALIHGSKFFHGCAAKNKFFPINLAGVNFVIDEIYDDLFEVKLIDSILTFDGNRKAAQRFSNSLLNIFSDPPEKGAHIHFDYIGDGSLLKPTKFSITIIFRN